MKTCLFLQNAVIIISIKNYQNLTLIEEDSPNLKLSKRFKVQVNTKEMILTLLLFVFFARASEIPNLDTTFQKKPPEVEIQIDGKSTDDQKLSKFKDYLQTICNSYGFEKVFLEFNTPVYVEAMGK